MDAVSLILQWTTTPRAVRAVLALRHEVSADSAASSCQRGSLEAFHLSLVNGLGGSRPLSRAHPSCTQTPA